jgi:hypothetical protein
VGNRLTEQLLLLLQSGGLALDLAALFLQGDRSQLLVPLDQEPLSLLAGVDQGLTLSDQAPIRQMVVRVHRGPPPVSDLFVQFGDLGAVCLDEGVLRGQVINDIW